MSKWTLEVDGMTCVGSGMCTSIAPDHFRLEGTTSTPINAAIDRDEVVIDAAESCPMEAILVRDANGAVLAPEQ